MDGTELFESMLAPGERLLWTGEKAGAVRDCLVGLTIPAILITGFGQVFVKLLNRWKGPLPTYLLLELGLLATFALLPIVLAWRQFKRTKDTAYAVTDRRLMIAVGPERETIRAFPLKAVENVQLRNTRRTRGLYFGVRGKSANIFWAGSGWMVKDPAAVSKLVDEAKERCQSADPEARI